MHSVAQNHTPQPHKTTPQPPPPPPAHRVLRPDRLSAAMKKYVGNILGYEFITTQPFDLARSCMDATPATPVFVFLSPGVDVAAAVEALGRVHGMTADTGMYCSVSLGQVCAGLGTL